MLRAPFKRKVERAHSQLKVLNEATVLLQKRHYNAAQSQDVLTTLLECIDHAIPGSPLHGCALGSDYIRIGAPKRDDVKFHSGVIKIQTDKVIIMTEAERQACLILREDFGNDDTDDDDNEEDDGEEEEDDDDDEVEDEEEDFTLLAEVKRKKLRRDPSSEYINCDFIPGSAVEVERLWSHAELILRTARRKMSPILFEALLFIKFNHRFWDVHLVADAISEVRRSNRLSARDAAEREYNNLHGLN